MNDFTIDILQKLRLIIALRMLHSEDNIREIYKEMARARTPGMLLEAIRNLPEEEIKEIQSILSKEKIIPRSLKISKVKYISPGLSLGTSNKDFKRKQRLEMLDRIRKNRLGQTNAP